MNKQSHTADKGWSWNVIQGHKI